MDADFAKLIRVPKRRKNSFKLDDFIERDDSLYAVFETNL